MSLPAVCLAVGCMVEVAVTVCCTAVQVNKTSEVVSLFYQVCGALAVAEEVRRGERELCSVTLDEVCSEGWRLC